MGHEEDAGAVPAHCGPEGPTRRDLFISAAAAPMAVALAYLGAYPAFCWGDETSPSGGGTRDTPLTEKLHAEYAEECQVCWRYTAFAARAKEEGYPNIARLFRAAAEAERVHAAALLFVMGAVKETAHNLKASADYEGFLCAEVLPGSIKHAEKEKDYAASTALSKFLDASRVHQRVFTQALEALKAGNDLGDTPMYVCPACGAVIVGNATDRCPVCKTARAMFLAAK